MRLRRQILRPAAFLAGVHANRQAEALLRAHRRCRQTQAKLLRKLLALHKDTAFGRDHGFSEIHGYADFTSRVPLATYESLSPYLRRVYEGQTTALFPPSEELIMFAMTSGTTGQPKRIPVTAKFLRQMKRGSSIFGVRALLAHPQGWLRPIVQLSSPADEATSPGGLPCGAISGMMIRTQKSIVRRMYVVPPSVARIADPATKYYAALRCSVHHDIAFIVTANPSSTIKLIETGQVHAEQLVRDIADGTCTPPGELPPELAAQISLKPQPQLARRIEEGIRADGVLLPKHFWRPAFLANWTGGTLKLYLPRLRELFGEVPIRDIGLLASEGRFSIPMVDETPAGLAEVTGNFFEFIPADQHDAERPDTLPAADVQIGGEYFLVVTNFAGLWRYCIDDRVRITDRRGSGPMFEFLCRGVSTANITGEKITEYQVVEAMRCATAGRQGRIDRFVVQGRFAATPYYQVRFEPVDGLDPADVARRFEAALRELNVEYESKRSSERLGPARAVVLPPGTLGEAEAQLISLRRGQTEQYKHQYLLTDVVQGDS